MFAYNVCAHAVVLEENGTASVHRGFCLGGIGITESRLVGQMGAAVQNSRQGDKQIRMLGPALALSRSFNAPPLGDHTLQMGRNARNHNKLEPRRETRQVRALDAKAWSKRRIQVIIVLCQSTYIYNVAQHGQRITKKI